MVSGESGLPDGHACRTSDVGMNTQRVNSGSLSDDDGSRKRLRVCTNNSSIDTVLYADLRRKRCPAEMFHGVKDTSLILRCRDLGKSLPCSNNIISSSSANGIVMRKSVWGQHIPDEVIMTIMAHLPLRSGLLLRLVCKRWSVLQQNQCFRDIRTRVATSPSFCIRRYLGGLSCFDSVSEVQEYSLSSIYSFSAGFGNCRIVSSVSGLLLATMDANPDALHVINPLQMTRRQLPPMLSSRLRNYTVGMVVNPETKVYSILATFNESDRVVAVQLYDSRCDSWQMAGSVRRDSAPLAILGVVMHKGYLHCLTDSRVDQFHARSRVLRYAQEQWHEVPGLMGDPIWASNVFSYPLLFENRGRLMLARAELNMSFLLVPPTSGRSLIIWRHDEVKGVWIQDGCIAAVCRELGFSILNSSFYLDACGDYLCLGTCSLSTRYTPHLSPNHPKVLLYNIAQGSWRILDRPPGFQYGRVLSCDLWERHGYFYEPRLDALV